METWWKIILTILGGTVASVLCCCCRNQEHSEEEQLDEYYDLTESINSETYNNRVQCISSAMIAPGDQSSINNGCNCWGWAIQKITGDFKNGNPPGYKQGCTINELAKMTVNGVIEAGAEKAEILGNLSDEKLQDQISNLKNNEYLIAMRVGSANIAANTKVHYYHYMRYSDGVWTHKAGVQGNFYQLRNTTPNNYTVWTCPGPAPHNTTIHLSGNRKKDSEIYKSHPTYYVKVVLKTG